MQINYINIPGIVETPIEEIFIKGNKLSASSTEDYIEALVLSNALPNISSVQFAAQKGVRKDKFLNRVRDWIEVNENGIRKFNVKVEGVLDRFYKENGIANNVDDYIKKLKEVLKLPNDEITYKNLGNLISAGKTEKGLIKNPPNNTTPGELTKFKFNQSVGDLIKKSKQQSFVRSFGSLDLKRMSHSDFMNDIINPFSEVLKKNKVSESDIDEVIGQIEDNHFEFSKRAKKITPIVIKIRGGKDGVTDINGDKLDSNLYHTAVLIIPNSEENLSIDNLVNNYIKVTDNFFSTGDSSVSLDTTNQRQIGQLVKAIKANKKLFSFEKLEDKKLLGDLQKRWEVRVDKGTDPILKDIYQNILYKYNKPFGTPPTKDSGKNINTHALDFREKVGFSKYLEGLIQQNKSGFEGAWLDTIRKNPEGGKSDVRRENRQAVISKEEFLRGGDSNRFSDKIMGKRLDPKKTFVGPLIVRALREGIFSGLKEYLKFEKNRFILDRGTNEGIRYEHIIPDVTLKDVYYALIGSNGLSKGEQKKQSDLLKTLPKSDKWARFSKTDVEGLIRDLYHIALVDLRIDNILDASGSKTGIDNQFWEVILSLLDEDNRISKVEHDKIEKVIFQRYIKAGIDKEKLVSVEELFNDSSISPDGKVIPLVNRQDRDNPKPYSIYQLSESKYQFFDKPIRIFENKKQDLNEGDLVAQQRQIVQSIKTPEVRKVVEKLGPAGALIYDQFKVSGLPLFYREEGEKDANKLLEAVRKNPEVLESSEEFSKLIYDFTFNKSMQDSRQGRILNDQVIEGLSLIYGLFGSDFEESFNEFVKLYATIQALKVGGKDYKFEIKNKIEGLKTPLTGIIRDGDIFKFEDPIKNQVYEELLNFYRVADLKLSKQYEEEQKHRYRYWLEFIKDHPEFKEDDLKYLTTFGIKIPKELRRRVDTASIKYREWRKTKNLNESELMIQGVGMAGIMAAALGVIGVMVINKTKLQSKMEEIAKESVKATSTANSILKDIKVDIEPDEPKRLREVKFIKSIKINKKK